MDARKYLKRIGIDGEPEPTAANLKRLQRAHLLHVPFENLDIHWKRPIVLDIDSFYRKVVESNRGGFCYELNGLFSEQLRTLGYETRLVSARVADGKDGFGPEYDHAAIIATIDGEEWLVDVGFGAFAAESLKAELDVPQQDATGEFVISEHEDGYLIVIKDGEPSYIFKPIARDLSEFTGMCEFHQTSPESHFTRGTVCSLMTETGRKTFRGNGFIVTVGDRKTESEVSPEDIEILLETEFGVKM